MSQASTLPESRLYTFIDESREFALYFLEGQKLIRDLALLHPIRGAGFAYFRDVVLSIQPMIALIKAGEQFGFYIDSDSPLFRLKIETGHHGAMRCMLLPEEFEEFPEAMRGLVRFHLHYPEKAPYESVLEADGLPLREIVNHVLRDSYQVNCAALVSQSSDQSLLLHQLPPLPGKDEYEYSRQAVRDRRAEIQDAVARLFALSLTDPEELTRAFSDIGFRLLTGRPVRFQCSCSRVRMIQGLQPLYEQNRHNLFDPGRESLEVKCEYCKTPYRITRTDLDHAPNPLN